MVIGDSPEVTFLKRRIAMLEAEIRMNVRGEMQFPRAVLTTKEPMVMEMGSLVETMILTGVAEFEKESNVGWHMSAKVYPRRGVDQLQVGYYLSPEVMLTHSDQIAILDDMQKRIHYDLVRDIEKNGPLR